MHFSAFSTKFIVVGLALLGPGCQSKLPGPIACEKMAFAFLERSPEEAPHSPLLRRLSSRLTHGCLTVPFDQQMLSCVEAKVPIQQCSASMLERAPERKAALVQLMTEMNQLAAAQRVFP